MDLNDEARIRQIVREEIANSTTSHKKKKGNREPSKWQIFLGDCSKQLSKEMSMGEKVKACSVQYKKIKQSNPKLLEDMVARSKSQNQQPPTNQPQRMNQPPTNQPQRLNQPPNPPTNPTNQPQRLNQPPNPPTNPTNQPQRTNKN